MKSYNAIDFKGRLYDHNLEEKDFDKGAAITGDVTLEVSEKGDKVKVRYFARPTYGNGKVNRTYGMLNDIMSGNLGTVVSDGDDAEWLALTGNLDASYFPARDGSCTGPDDLNKSLRVRGAFINQNRKHDYKNMWQVDMLITRIREVEANEERGFAEYVEVSGFYVDSYNERVMELSVRAYDEAAMNYFKSITDQASPDTPIFARVWGERRTMTTKFIQESMFGENQVSERENEFWVITGMQSPYDFGDEAVMTADQYENLRKALDEHKKEVFETRTSENEDGGTGNLAF